MLQAGGFRATTRISGSYVDRFGPPPSVHTFAFPRCFLCYPGAPNANLIVVGQRRTCLPKFDLRYMGLSKVCRGMFQQGARYCPCTAARVSLLVISGRSGVNLASVDPGWSTAVRKAAAKRKKPSDLPVPPGRCIGASFQAGAAQAASEKNAG